MVTKENIEFARRLIDGYTAAARKHEAIAKTCAPKARGGHVAAVTKNLKAAQRWEETLAAQLGWLAMNNTDLFHEVKDD